MFEIQGTRFQLYSGFLPRHDIVSQIWTKGILCSISIGVKIMCIKVNIQSIQYFKTKTISSRGIWKRSIFSMREWYSKHPITWNIQTREWNVLEFKWKTYLWLKIIFVSLPLLYCLTQCWTSVFSNVFSHLAGHYILVHLRQASLLHQIVLHLMMSALCLFALF